MISDSTRTDLIRLGLLWLVAVAIGEAAISYLIGRYPVAASEQAVITAEAVFFLLRVTFPPILLVALIIVYSMIRFRVSEDDNQPGDRQYRSSRAFPWTWVTISAALNVLFVVYPGAAGLQAIWSAAAATDPLEVDVTASQWQWRFTYPAQDVADQADLVVPVDTPIRFVLRSEDVIHSFWVPAWGIKKEVVPGSTWALVVTPNRILDTTTDPMMRVQCSQICGAGHAEMRSAVRVVAKADFDKWIEAARASQGQMPGMEMPGMEMPATETPATETPGMEMPGMETPGTEMPGMNMNAEPPGDAAPMDEQMRMDGAAPIDGQMNMEGQN